MSDLTQNLVKKKTIRNETISLWAEVRLWPFLAVNVKFIQPFVSQHFAAMSHCNAMIRRGSLLGVDKGRALAWFQDGTTFWWLLAVSECPLLSFGDCNKDSKQATGKFQDTPRPGSPRQTINREHLYVVRQALTSRHYSQPRQGTDWIATNTRVSDLTVKNCLLQAQLHSGIPARHLKRTAAHLATSRAWSMRHRNRPTASRPTSSWVMRGDGQLSG